MARRFLFLAAVLAGAPAAFTRGESPDPKGVDFFETKIRPILVERCYECHSAESKRLRGKLLLDTKAGWEKGGDTGPAIVPGKPEESLLIEAIGWDNEAMKMPPKGKLPPDAVAALTDWVKMGAPDPRTGPSAAPKPGRVIDIAEGKKHWAFQPLAKSEPPPVKDNAWCRTPIDRYILAKLEEKGLSPSPEADRRVLIRRAYFDITGLPPTPEQVDAFVADMSENAWEKVVDELLQSPRYGERWARHWLDLARFAESHGFEHDYDRPYAYHYRDFVIEALNRDLPYDTFVKWQLAGDEFAPGDPLALKATGFLAAGTHSTQITKNQVEKERYDELDDMVGTTGTAFLGLTIGCARCHDHKYDPIPTRDYYRMVATFTTTVRSEMDLNLDPEGFAKAQAKYDAEHRPYVEAIARFEAERLPSRLATWESERASKKTEAVKWVALDASKVESKGGATLSKQPDGSILATGKNPDFDTYTFVAACDMPKLTAVRLEVFADPKLVAGGPGRAANGNFDLTDFKVVVGPRYGIGKTETPGLINPKADFEQPGLPIAAAIDADAKSGWAVDPQFGKDHLAVFEFPRDLAPDGGATLTFTLDFQGNNGHNFGRFRLSVTDSPRPVGLDGDGVPPNLSAVLAKSIDARTPDETKAILDWYKSIDAEWQALKLAADEHAKTAPKPNGTKVLISSEGVPAVRLHTQGGDFLEKTHLLKRGDPNQKLGEVNQGFLQVLTFTSEGERHWPANPPKGSRTSYRRTALANWLTDVDSGAGRLLARVIVNRLWQHHLGEGLVPTPSDFGAAGERPSHPELVDALASDLVAEGWRLKPIHKRILMSAVYLQSSKIDPAKVAIDPDDRLCWRQTQRRLEAESIRDAMLFISGMLDERMYGPGTLEANMKRRSIYFTVKRSRLVPMMILFDAPDALVPIGRRAATTVAPQSLLMLNNPIVREWAAGFARRIAPNVPGDWGPTVDAAYRIALGRTPTAEERADGIAFIGMQLQAHGGPEKPNAVESALADYAQVVLSLNEFLFIE